MNLFIDNNDGYGPQDYTAWLDTGHMPTIVRRLNCAATMTAALIAANASFRVPVSAARLVLQRGDGFRLFTGNLTAAPEQLYLGYGSVPAWRYELQAIDDSLLLDENPLPGLTPFAWRTAGNALSTLATDVLPGGLDESGVQDVSQINQFPILFQKNWTYHAQELATMTRATYRAHDGKLLFQPVGQSTFTISEMDPNFDPQGLALVQPTALRNDVTVIGELEPVDYVRDYFLGDGTTLDFYLSQTPYSAKTVTIFEDDFTSPLDPTLWQVSDPAGKVSVSGGQLNVNGGPSTVTYVEQVELAGGLLLQHGDFVFQAASSGIVGGIYNGAPATINCIAGLMITPNGSNSNIQALVNGSTTGPVVTTTAGHQYGLVTQLFSIEGHRVQQTYFSSTHPAGSGRGGAAIASTLRVVLTVHDVDPNNPGTLAAVATVLYDGVLASAPGFATYALISESSLFASVFYTRIEHIIAAEVRSMVPNGQFRTRLMSALSDGGECYISSTGELHFYPPYPPQANEQIVVSYRTSSRAMARVEDQNSIAQHAHGADSGRRVYVHNLKLPPAPTSIDCEESALALLDDSVQTAWNGEYQIVSDYLPVEDVVPGNTVQVSAPSRGAVFSAIVREVKVEVLSLAGDHAQYAISFANDAAEPLAFKFESMTLPAPLTTIFTTTLPSSSFYIDSLTSAQVTDIIATEITVDAGVAPPAGGFIEVRWSDGGWGGGNSGNLAGRFTTQVFTVPRLARVQSYYLRQYNGSSPAKYSRYSALLHVDYPY